MVLEFSREDTAKQANIKIMLSIFQKQKAANLKSSPLYSIVYYNL
jgi:hypothetical protein